MNEILEYFKLIAATPHCSFQAHELRDKIIAFAKECGFEVKIDESNNVLCQKGNPKICLQAHYDMVCIGDVANIELVFDAHILRAKNSTLGADNGMGMAIMFACMKEFENLECLFTSDEEVGLIGATNLGLQIESKYLLNLDGEQEDEIYVACAGGVDVIATCKLETQVLPEDYDVYEIRIEGLAGGHSGVDIDKNIPSAIKLLVNELMQQKELKLLHLEGGEMRNSIPKSAKALIATKQKPISTCKYLFIEQKAQEKRVYLKNSDKIIKVLHSFAQGVRAFDKSYMIPSISINLGKIRQNTDCLQIDCSARAMADADLLQLASETKSLFELADFKVKMSQMHPAWVPNIGDFTKIVQETMQTIYKGIELKAIHAGLECGVLMKTQDKDIEALSIGPTIRFPHSLREECDLESVKRIYKIVQEIIQKVE